MPRQIFIAVAGLMVSPNQINKPTGSVGYGLPEYHFPNHYHRDDQRDDNGDQPKPVPGNFLLPVLTKLVRAFHKTEQPFPIAGPTFLSVGLNHLG